MADQSAAASESRGESRVFSSLEALNAALSLHEEETLSKFIVSRKEKEFGQKIDKISAVPRTQWKLKHVPYDGMPFKLVGNISYCCHLGPDLNVKTKERYHADKEKQALEARHRQVQHTKKTDCPARFTVSQVIKFPAFKIEEDKESNRKAASAALKKAIETDASRVEAVVEYHARFPDITEHRYHPTSGQTAELQEPIDPRVKDQIVKLTLAGVRRVDEVRRHLATFVADELFRGQKPPPQTRHRFNPTDKDIRNLMKRTRDSTSGIAAEPAEVDDEALPPCADLPPRKKQRKTRLRTECASLLKEVTGLTYHLQDETFLETLKEQITDIREDIRQHVPHDETLPLSVLG
ncbi:PREDICTED: calcium-responsive transcription factor-like isoform X1 [Branchiostoma belcheri]|uniref:Calcium-responsive transcription factor-like isoform X1 n=2 Tax=Branchiostoma belcheri TaxID=7741 RepID=A0A6P4YDM9_BRABE|nr:PREDICTED: calcium-responsive transcription factor-like isoform X1 [Branchiostoma belcheri]